MAYQRRPPGLGLLPQLGVLLCCVVRCVTDAGDVESARCRVRCLAHLKDVLGENSDDVNFENCFRNDVCTSCLRPCGQPFISTSHCIQLCQSNEAGCEESCHFLRYLRTVRPGVCPSRYDLQGSALSCVEECVTDSDCDEMLKCCDTDCAQVCHVPDQLFVGVPEIPGSPQIRERENTGVVDVSWQPVVARNSSPSLYMVQSRHNVGHHHSDVLMTPWKQITQTTDTAIVVRDMGPGRWYSFRVASIGINGTKGFSIPTQPYKLQKEPLPPGAPQNLTEGETKFQDGRMTMMIHWVAPRKSDLPVARYKVYWSQRLVNPNIDSVLLRESKRIVPGDELKYELDDLEEDTEYLVQVQAISVYGDVRLKSPRCSMYLRTTSLQSNTQNDSLPPEVGIRSRVTLPALKDVQMQPMYFYNSQLKANVTWQVPVGYNTETYKVIIHWIAQVCIAADSNTSLSQPMSATTHATFFIIYNLRFECRYKVMVQLTSPGGEIGEATELSTAAPSCANVKVIGPGMPVCPTYGPVPPEEPRSLTYSFLLMHNNITAKLMWEPPPSAVEITSYRLVWGQTLPEPDQLNPVLNQETALTKVLPKEVFMYHVGSLRGNAMYMVRLQALSPAGSGRAAEIIFRTPVLKSQQGVAAPPYSVEGQSHQGLSPSFNPTLRPLPSDEIILPFGVGAQNSSAANIKYSQLCVQTLVCLLMLVIVRSSQNIH